MTEKELYTSPEVLIFSVRTEGTILTGSQDTLGINDWSTDGGVSFDF